MEWLSQVSISRAERNGLTRSEIENAIAAIDVERHKGTIINISINSQQYFFKVNKTKRRSNDTVQVELAVLYLNQLYYSLAAFSTLARAGSNLKEDCSICLVEFQEKDLLLILKCSHFFHNECIMEWFQRSLSCPYCRKEIRGFSPIKSFIVNE